MRVAELIYLGFAAGAALLYAQTRVSGYFYAKERHGALLAQTVEFIDNRTLDASKYDFYQDRTRVEMFQILANLRDARVALSRETHPQKLGRALAESAKRIEEAGAKAKAAHERFLSLQEKEKRVFDRIERLELSLLREDSPEAAKECELLKRFAQTDILKAYDFAFESDNSEQKEH